MKLYISADIEGVAGIVSRDQCFPSGFDYEPARRLMTAEVLAAIAGARKAGVDEFVVSDSHGNGQNLLIEEFAADTTLVRCWPRRLSMMSGLEDGGFCGAFFLGYHAGVGNAAGGLAHTFSSKALSAVQVNSVPVNEAYFNAALAGQFSVPVLLATGDDAFVAEVNETVRPLRTVTSQWTLGTLSARCKMPKVVRAEITDAAEQAVRARGDATPFVVETPIVIDLTMVSRLSVEVLDYLPIIERTGPLSIRFSAPDMTEATKIVEFILSYEPIL